jgi:voltage-gated potassium channel Kch
MRRLRRWWSAIQWPVLGAAAVAALVLGWLGFRAHAEATGDELGVLTAAYRSIQLFVLEFGANEPPSVPATLQIARVLAPVVSGYAAAWALARLFRNELDRLALRWRRDHVIVCGLGPAGSILARSLADAGWKVAAIDPDPARRAGVRQIVADPADPGALTAAGVTRAAHVVTLCGSDEANAAAAIAVRDVVGDAHRPVVHVNMVDPRLCTALRSEAVASGAALEFFTIYEQGARTLVDRYPIPQSGRAVLVGLGRLGRSVLVEIARRGDADEVIAVDRNATGIVADLRARWPSFGAAVRIEAVDLDAGSPEFERGRFLSAGSAAGPQAVYVCFADEPLSLSASLALLQRLKRLPAGPRPVDVVARVTRRHGLAELVARSTGGEAIARVRTFDLYRATLHEGLLLGAMREAMAEALHREYLATIGAAAGRPPTGVPWEELTEEVKEESRAAAAAVGPRLRAVGADIVPLTEWDGEPVELTPSEVELLAILEHRRWIEWRSARGFKPAAVSNFDRRLSRSLVPWGDLEEEAREVNRSFARVLPSVLASAGQRVVRLDRSVARSLHDEYLRARRAAGDTPETNASLVPWDALPESLRASNRDQAAHIRVKLLAVGYDAAPGDPDLGFSFSAAEVETLAEMEHERWVADRLFHGWSLGDTKDVDAKVTPYLVGWKDLAEEVREVDREFVRSIPAMLAGIGMRIVPASDAASEPIRRA